MPRICRNIAWCEKRHDIKRVSVGHVPSGTYLGLEEGNEDVAENFVACWACEDGVCKVFRDGGRVAKVVREKDGFGAEMGNVVEPSDGVVPMVRSCIAMGLVSLGTEVSEKDDGRVVRASEKSADKCFKLFH